jgi:transcriptional regulator
MGKVKLIENEDPGLWESMIHLTEKYEEPYCNYLLEEGDPAYISKGFVVFTLTIEKIEGKAKLSQIHLEERVERVIEALESTG